MFPRLYNTTPEIRALATRFLMVVAASSPLHGFLNGAYFTLRSGGKTVITFLFDAGYIWVVSVSLAFLLMHLTPLSAVTAFFICQMVDLFKCLLGGYLMGKGIWVKNIVSHRKPAAEALPEGEVE